MTAARPKEMVEPSLLYPVLYGAGKTFAYLGMRGQDMLDKIGEGILEYCFKEGYIERSNDPMQLAGRIEEFFVKNGYFNGIEHKQEGDVSVFKVRSWPFLGVIRKLRDESCYLLSCPMCMALNTVMKSNGVMRQIISEEILPDGSYEARMKIVPLASLQTPAGGMPKLANLSSIKTQLGSEARVRAPAFEALAFGLARGFDYLGAQAQLLLDNVGSGIIEFLHDEKQLTLPAEPSKSLPALAGFYSSQALADKIKVNMSGSEVTVGFENYQYAPVLKRIIEERLPLVSCPFTLAARTLLRSAGMATGTMSWNLQGSRDATLTMPITRIDEQEFNEEKIALLMDAA